MTTLYLCTRSEFKEKTIGVGFWIGAFFHVSSLQIDRTQRRGAVGFFIVVQRFANYFEVPVFVGLSDLPQFDQPTRIDAGVRLAPRQVTVRQRIIGPL